MRVVALVAARGGSQRVQDKNTRPFADSTLLDIKLGQLIRVRGIDEIVVSSENERILKIARKHGCVAKRRPGSLASSEAPMSEVYRHMASELEAEAILYANCTSPLIRDATVEDLIETFMSMDEEHDSVSTTSLVREFLLRDGSPINYDPANQPRSQDLPRIDALNFAINILPRTTMIERKNVLGYAPVLRVLDEIEGIDIDTPTDFAVAEFLYESYGGEAHLRRR